MIFISVSLEFCFIAFYGVKFMYISRAKSISLNTWFALRSLDTKNRRGQDTLKRKAMCFTSNPLSNHPPTTFRIRWNN